MMTFYFVVTGIVLFVGAITLMDWLARRKERREQHKSSS